MAELVPGNELGHFPLILGISPRPLLTSLEREELRLRFFSPFLAPPSKPNWFSGRDPQNPGSLV